MLSTVKGSKFY